MKILTMLHILDLIDSSYLLWNEGLMTYTNPRLDKYLSRLFLKVLVMPESIIL